MSGGYKGVFDFAWIHDGLLGSAEVIAQQMILLACNITGVFGSGGPSKTVYYRAVDGACRLVLANIVEIKI